MDLVPIDQPASHPPQRTAPRSRVTEAPPVERILEGEYLGGDPGRAWEAHRETRETLDEVSDADIRRALAAYLWTDRLAAPLRHVDLYA